MDDPFASIIPLCQISSSQRDLSLSPCGDATDSQQSETPGWFKVESTQICMESPPESPEAKGGAISDDKFETPPEVAVPAASSEEQWFGCDGGTTAVGAEDEKTVDLGRDTDLGFTEVGVTQKVEADSESRVKVELSERELGEFMAWKRRLASMERSLDERPLKQLVSGNDSNLNSSRAGDGVRYAEEKSVENVSKSIGDLKSSSSTPGLQSPESLQMKDQTLIQSDKGTEALSLDPGPVSDAEIAKNCLELNACTEAARVDDDDSTEEVVLDSEENHLVSDVVIAKNGFASTDSTEVVMLGSEDTGLISGAGIAKDGQVLIDGPENGVDDGSDVGRAEDVKHHGEKIGVRKNIEDIDKFRYVAPSEGLISGAPIVKNGRVSNDGPENGVDDGSRRAEESQQHGERMGGEKNIEDIDKFRYVAPSGSDSTERPKAPLVLPVSMHVAAKEGDSGENHNMKLVMSILKMLSKKDPDPRFENLSFLEIAKLRGITFPRPRWWGEEEKEE